MWYLYFNRELIAISTDFSEIADIFLVECLNLEKDSYHYNICGCLFNSLFVNWFSDKLNDYACIHAADDCIFEVYHGERT